MPPTSGRRQAILVVVTCLLLGAGCASHKRATIGARSVSGRKPPAVAPSTTAPPPPFDIAVLTPDGNDVYVVSPIGPDAAGVLAPGGNTDTNLRIVFWRSGSPPAVDAEACDTWSSSSYPLSQEGVALRVSTQGGVTRAVTVTKNVFGRTIFTFNVHTWDSATGLPATPVGDVNLGATLSPDGVLVPGPWRMCARAVGLRVDVKVWPAIQAEPPWGDPGYTGSVALPAGWDMPGHTGWYVGHLQPGGSMYYGELRSDAVTAG